MKRDNQDIHKLMVHTFGTEAGKELLLHLTQVFVDRPIYRKGMTLDEVAFKEGQRDVIMQIIKELNIKDNK